MTSLSIVFGLLVLGCMGVIIALQLRKPQHTTNANEEELKQIAKLEKELEDTLKEKNELAGKGKVMYDNYKNLEADYKATLKERDTLVKMVNKFEAMQEQREKEHQALVKDQKAMVTALEKERERVIQNENEKRQMAEEERDRLWNDHENAVIASLVDLCKQPQFLFKSYSNTNLPDGFDGSLKPDFMIELFEGKGEYVIFDAKVSKAQNLQSYIDDQVKKTAEKVKKSGKIYPHIFLVVPTEAISELKKVIHAKDQYYFYVVSREALGPILASLKRISAYELAKDIDPQRRENIVNLMAEMMTQINMTSATSIIAAKRGVEILSNVQKNDPELAQEIEQKSREKTSIAYSPSEIKRLAASITAQNSEISSLVAPKAPISKKTIDAAETMIAQRLL